MDKTELAMQVSLNLRDAAPSHGWSKDEITHRLDYWLSRLRIKELWPDREEFTDEHVRLLTEDMRKLSS